MSATAYGSPADRLAIAAELYLARQSERTRHALRAALDVYRENKEADALAELLRRERELDDFAESVRNVESG